MDEIRQVFYAYQEGELHKVGPNGVIIPMCIMTALVKRWREIEECTITSDTAKTIGPDAGVTNAKTRT